MTVISFGLLYGSIITLFMIAMYIARRSDSLHLLRSSAVLLSVANLLLSITFKALSPDIDTAPQLIIVIAGFGFVLTMKLLELPFAYPWSYMRSMPWKLSLLYLTSFPKIPFPAAVPNQIPSSRVRQESLLIMLQGILEYISYRLYLHWIPYSWLTIPSSDLTVLARFSRLALLFPLFYLLLSYFPNFVFGLVGYLSNVPMDRMFPSFPFASTSLRDFWSYRWNNYVKSSLQKNSFAVLPQLLQPYVTITKKTSGLIASILSGLFHEYILWFITNRWNYKNMIFFVIHGLLVRMEIVLNIPARPTSFQGKCFGWLWAISAMLITCPLFFDPWIDSGIFGSMK